MVFISCDGVTGILSKIHTGIKYELKLNRADSKNKAGLLIEGLIVNNTALNATPVASVSTKSL